MECLVLVKACTPLYKKFYGRVQELNQVEQGSLFGTVQKAAIQKGEIKVPELDELLKIYEVCWIPDWYKDKKQREGYFKKGRKFYAPFINRTLANGPCRWP